MAKVRSDPTERLLNSPKIDERVSLTTHEVSSDRSNRKQ